MNDSNTTETPPRHRAWWKSGVSLMISGLLVGFILSWSGFLLDWIFDVIEGSYVMLTMPLFGILGLCLFISGLVTFMIAALRRSRGRDAQSKN